MLRDDMRAGTALRNGASSRSGRRLRLSDSPMLVSPRSGPSERRDPDTSSGREPPFRTLTPEARGARLACGPDGVTAAEAACRLARHMARTRDAKAQVDGAARAVLRRMVEPLALLLMAAGLVTFLTGDWTGGAIIIAILMLSIGLDTIQDGQALRRSVALARAARRGAGGVLAGGPGGRLALPFTPRGGWLGFAAPSPGILAAVAAITAAYLAVAETVKPWATAGGTGRPAAPARARA